MRKRMRSETKPGLRPLQQGEATMKMQTISETTIGRGDRVRLVVPSGPNEGQTTCYGTVEWVAWRGIDGRVVCVREDTGKTNEHCAGWVRRA
jgi:hypothetical protein